MFLNVCLWCLEIQYVVVMDSRWASKPPPPPHPPTQDGLGVKNPCDGLKPIAYLTNKRECQRCKKVIPQGHTTYGDMTYGDMTYYGDTTFARG